MTNLSDKMSKTVGLPPGTIIHIGDKSSEKPKITVIDYDEKDYTEHSLDQIEDCRPYLYKKTVTWINIDGIHDTSLIERAGVVFGLHPLVMEDIVNTTQRPKFEDYEDFLFVVLKMLLLCPEEKKEGVWAEQVSIVMTKNYVVTFQEKEGDVFNTIRERLKTAKGRIRKAGADYLAYALMDAITDHYFIILEKLGEEIEDLEDSLVKFSSNSTARQIHSLKREIIYLRKAVWPLRELISGMIRSESEIITKTTQIYLRDLYDHTVQVIDTIETERDIVSGMLDIYLTSLSNRMNEIVKVLTIISTIFIPLTFIAGVYGMNFSTGASPFNMPELNMKYGYLMCIGIMIVVALSMLLFFKRKKWI